MNDAFRVPKIDLKQFHPGEGHQFPWVSNVMDLKKEKNFFETRVTD